MKIAVSGYADLGYNKLEDWKMSSQMNSEQPNNLLHRKTLETILHHLVDHYGWEEMGARIKINCFNDNPSIQSSLKFLRKTSWARTKVEKLYLESIKN